VDVNVHPAKTEVRFRQGSFVHDFVRDSVRTALMKARPAASFFTALTAAPTAGSSLMVDVSPLAGVDQPVFEPRADGETLVAESEPVIEPGDVAAFSLSEKAVPPSPGRLGFEGAGMAVGYEEPTPPFRDEAAKGWATRGDGWGTQATQSGGDAGATLNSLATLKPLGQLRDSFILATNEEGLWIVDQHVAHERVLFEKILRERKVEQVQRQRLLMPVLVELLPEQMVTFAAIAEELERNGFEAEPFGPRTLAVKATPVGLEGKELERVLEELLGATEKTAQVENEELRRTRIAASIACHAAIKVNMPLERAKIDWLLAELGKTEHPMSCPHGRPIALRYSLREIQRAFQRI
jgi:DNA mismatch repair protein MutL